MMNFQILYPWQSLQKSEVNKFAHKKYKNLTLNYTYNINLNI